MSDPVTPPHEHQQTEVPKVLINAIPTPPPAVYKKSFPKSQMVLCQEYRPVNN
jgi:hypothetical protein